MDVTVCKQGHSVEKREIHSHQEIFRQINSLVTYLVNPLLSRNICQKCVRENFRNFHTVGSEILVFTHCVPHTQLCCHSSEEKCRIYSPKLIFVKSQLGNYISKNVLLSKFVKNCESEFP